jgi:hypothetical protein
MASCSALLLEVLTPGGIRRCMPMQEFMTWRTAEDSKIEADRSKLIPGM